MTGREWAKWSYPPGFYYVWPIYIPNIGPSCGCNYGTVRVLDTLFGDARYAGSPKKSNIYNMWIVTVECVFKLRHKKMLYEKHCIIFSTACNSQHYNHLFKSSLWWHHRTIMESQITCLFKSLFRLTKKLSQLHITGLWKVNQKAPMMPWFHHFIWCWMYRMHSGDAIHLYGYKAYQYLHKQCHSEPDGLLTQVW